MVVKEKMKQRLQCGLMALVGILMFGCASLTTFQTARTIPPGKVKWTVGYSQLTGKEKEKSILGKLGQNSVEIGCRGGITDRLDVGGKVYLIGTLVDLKYQLVKDNPLDIAIGGGLGYTWVEINKVKQHFIDLYTPLYFSKQLGPIELYLVPKNIFRVVVGGEKTIMSNYLGAGVGFCLNVGDFSVMPECNYYLASSEGKQDNVICFGIAVGRKMEGGLEFLKNFLPEE